MTVLTPEARDVVTAGPLVHLVTVNPPRHIRSSVRPNVRGSEPEVMFTGDPGDGYQDLPIQSVRAANGSRSSLPM
jgi:hypothetical protein